MDLHEVDPGKNRLAAWLYAQFVTAKTVSLKKTLVGLTPIRESDIQSQAMTDAAPNLGGLVEFYRSPARLEWSPTGTNVPDYPKLAQLWWQYISRAVSGETSVQNALDGLADAQDRIMERLERANVQPQCGPSSTSRAMHSTGSTSRVRPSPSSRTRSLRARPFPTPRWSSRGRRAEGGKRSLTTTSSAIMARPTWRAFLFSCLSCRCLPWLGSRRCGRAFGL